MQSELSFEQYAAWCKSRFPPVDPGPPPESFSKTVPASGEEPCPVTVRSARNGFVVSTRSQGSR